MGQILRGVGRFGMILSGGLGVFLEVAVIARDTNLLRDLRALGLERRELGSQGGMPIGGHRYPVHRPFVARYAGGFKVGN